ncbi:Xaa-Pro dipeptidase [Marinicella sp. S1101]|uniref:Xaa-Pro dipeptidase n=1 Tax=Marinicella marina TaxID=2996016 RepID=UPI00226095D0|nr:Xaa-Pro dipeptidase [Marinicella marina]MCX7554222.1 Xaa-Pro dipeptidase [Marinicella marina]MDJ1138785.1 Xaa-Pro dipeptidase [Marinicella marina]
MGLFKNHIEHISAITTAALAHAGYDGLFIYSGHPVNNFMDDMAPPHSINPHFKWWVPVPDVVSSVVHFVPGEKPTVYLNQPADFWHKVVDNSQGKWAEHFNVKVVGHYSELPDFKQAKNHAWIGSTELQPLAAEHTNPEKLINYLHFNRIQKTDYEIHCIGEANKLALKGHAAAEAAFREGMSEYEIHMAYLQACAHNEHQMPYGNIVALNENPSVLHYQYQSRERYAAVDLKSFLIDAGANYKGYAADITRTYAYNDGLFAEMIQSMDEKQQQLCQAAVVGQDYVALHRQAHVNISEVLREAGVFTCSAEAAVESGLSQTFFPHGLGHYLGLQVHDVSGHVIDANGTVKSPPKEYPFLRLTDTLRQNAVITIEPGLYFIPMLMQEIAGHNDVNWDKVDELIPYGGIRIEDNVVVKAEDSINLSR